MSDKSSDILRTVFQRVKKYFLKVTLNQCS